MKEIENARAFGKEVIDIAKKYGVKSISSCGRCDGTSLFFEGSDNVDNFELSNDQVTFACNGENFKVSE